MEEGVGQEMLREAAVGSWEWGGKNDKTRGESDINAVGGDIRRETWGSLHPATQMLILELDITCVAVPRSRGGKQIEVWVLVDAAIVVCAGKNILVPAFDARFTRGPHLAGFCSTRRLNRPMPVRSVITREFICGSCVCNSRSPQHPFAGTG